MTYFSVEALAIGLQIDENEFVVNCTRMDDGMWAITTGDVKPGDAPELADALVDEEAESLLDALFDEFEENDSIGNGSRQLY